MSQLNFYVPDDVEKEIRLAAQNEGKSISAFLAELVKSKFPSQQWSRILYDCVWPVEW
jgi:CRISPR/Cas system CSM-associated protein Csm2 small subunit